jgi:hypothetical protein
MGERISACRFVVANKRIGLFERWPTIAQKNPCHAPDARMVKESPFRGRQKIADGACAASTGDNLPAA